MEQEQVLKARIANLTELRGLFQALRALAGSRLQEAQSALEGIRSYAEIIAAALADALALQAGAQPFDFGGGAALVVMGAEHGFVGGLNLQLLDEAVRRRRQGQILVVLGRRAATIAKERGIAVDIEVPMATHVAGVADAAHDLAEVLDQHANVDVIFARYRKGGNFEPAFRRLLPPELPAPVQRRGPAPLVQLPPNELLHRLDLEYIFAALSQALMDSFASENAARLRVMETADRSIADKLVALRLSENDLRQEAITAELLDLIVGAQAVARTGARGEAGEMGGARPPG